MKPKLLLLITLLCYATPSSTLQAQELIASVHYDIPPPVDRNAQKIKVKKDKINQKHIAKKIPKKDKSQEWNGLGMMIPGWIGFGLFSLIALYAFLSLSFGAGIMIIIIIAAVLAFIGLVMGIVGTIMFVKYKKNK